MTQRHYPNLSPADLRPGDWGLTLGRSEISKLIAGVGDSLYSHAFLVLDPDHLIEAAPGGVRIVPIAQRMAEASLLLFDVYRPGNGEGQRYSAQEIQAIQNSARRYLRRGYPLHDLLLLGLMSAMRNWLPEQDTLRWILRIALEALIRDDPTELVCSELIFRSLRDAAVQPEGALAPCIINPARTHAPMPPIDVAALIRELEQLFPKLSAADGESGAPLHAVVQAAFLDRGPIHDHTLQAGAEAVRAKFSLATPKRGVYIIPQPNPRAIFPADLERSPSVRFIGRMQLARG